MGTTIIIVIAAVTVVGVFAMLIKLRMSISDEAKRNHKENRSQKQAQDSALWAGALIVDARGGITGESASKARLTLTLEVTPPQGKPYRATAVWMVDITALHLASAGSPVPVRLNTSDPQKVYPAVPWATYVSQ
jgi:hypothetical protein